MAIICPTVTANNQVNFYRDLNRAINLSKRIHIDISDDIFSPVQSFPLDQIQKLPNHIQYDIHLMVDQPMLYLKEIYRLQPHLVIVHNESRVDHMYFSALLHAHNILSGLAFLQDTPIEYGFQIMHSFDHVMIFSGHLGYYGGQIDLSLIDKVKAALDYIPDLEIGWDGGINDQNTQQLVEAGVNILNVGYYLSQSSQPEEAYGKIKALIG